MSDLCNDPQEHDVSPYLRRPLRTLELAKQEIEQARDNFRVRAWAAESIRAQQQRIMEAA